MLTDGERERSCSDTSSNQRAVLTELHTYTCECQKCCDVTRSACAAVNLGKLFSCLKLEYFQWKASLVAPYTIRLRHAVNSPVVRRDVSVSTEGKHTQRQQ